MKYRLLTILALALFALAFRAYGVQEKLTVDCEKGVCTLSEKDFDMLIDANHRAAAMLIKLNDENKQCINRNRT